jgi:hypothetical protein
MQRQLTEEESHLCNLLVSETFFASRLSKITTLIKGRMNWDLDEMDIQTMGSEL